MWSLSVVFVAATWAPSFRRVPTAARDVQCACVRRCMHGAFDRPAPAVVRMNDVELDQTIGPACVCVTLAGFLHCWCLFAVWRPPCACARGHTVGGGQDELFGAPERSRQEISLHGRFG